MAWMLANYQAEDGLAWHYAQYSNDVAIYKAAKNACRLTQGLLG
jgi:hypothetical protein